MDASTLTSLVAGLRVGIGGALLAAPAMAGRIWIGPEATGAGTRVFARAIGARDVALGVRTLKAHQEGRPTRQLLELGVMADVADTAACLVAFRHLTRARGMILPLMASTVAVLGYLAIQEQDEERQAEGQDTTIDLTDQPVGAGLGTPIA